MPKHNFQITFIGRQKGSKPIYSSQSHSTQADSEAEAKVRVEKHFEVIKWINVQQTVIPPCMTAEKYAIKQAEVLNQLPKEFFGALSHLSYEQGHSSGYEECLNILSDLISELEGPIKAFEARIRAEKA